MTELREQASRALTDDRPPPNVTRWPRVENFRLEEQVHVVLGEEWHRLYAERDLTALEKEN